MKLYLCLIVSLFLSFPLDLGSRVKAQQEDFQEDTFDLSSSLSNYSFEFTQVVRVGSAIEVSWQLNNEEMTDYFAIERQISAQEFEIVGGINIQHPERLAPKHEFSDGNPLERPTSFYRIKHVAIDGKVIYSRLMKIYTPRMGNQTIPTQISDGELRVELSEKLTGPYTLRIMDQIGREVFIIARTKEYEAAETLHVGIGQLTPGTYILQIIGAQRTWTQRFVTF